MTDETLGKQGDKSGFSVCSNA